jgi:predicted transcriptional regulator
MGCVDPDGKPTVSGMKMLRALQSGSKTPEEVAEEAALPIYRVRGGLRDLAEYDFVSREDNTYTLTATGAEILAPTR